MTCRTLSPTQADALHRFGNHRHPVYPAALKVRRPTMRALCRMGLLQCRPYGVGDRSGWSWLCTITEDGLAALWAERMDAAGVRA